MILDISATGRTGAARAANVESLFDAVILTRRSLYCACLRILEAVGSPTSAIRSQQMQTILLGFIWCCLLLFGAA